MADPEIHYTVYRKPRMSVSMFGHYMAAEDDEKETILRDAKYAKTAIVITYKEARQVLVRYLTSDTRDKRILYDAIESWKARLGNPSITVNQADELRGCIDAIQDTLTNLNALGFSSMSTGKAPHIQPPLYIGDVKVSAHIDSFVFSKKRGLDRLGGIHVQLSKGKSDGKTEETQAKREKAATYSSLLIYRHLAESFNSTDKPPLSEISSFVNVRKGRVWSAPSNYKRMNSRLEAASRVISAMWRSIPDPADFDPAKARFVR